MGSFKRGVEIIQSYIYIKKKKTTEKMNRATVMSGIIRSGLTYMSSASLMGMRDMKDRKVSEEIMAESIKNFIK